MINQNELRIGNIVSFLGNWITVSAIGDFIASENGELYSPEDVHPVILNREVFKSFGFRGRVDFIYRDNLGIKIEKERFFICIKDLSNVLFHTIFELKYLHEIQNLYYSFHKKELDIIKRTTK